MWVPMALCAGRLSVRLLRRPPYGGSMGACRITVRYRLMSAWHSQIRLLPVTLASTSALRPRKSKTRKSSATSRAEPVPSSETPSSAGTAPGLLSFTGPVHRLTIASRAGGYIDRTTKEYVVKRTEEGRSKREIMRCLKRHIPREAYRQITNRNPRTHGQQGLKGPPAPTTTGTYGRTQPTLPAGTWAPDRIESSIWNAHTVRDLGSLASCRRGGG